MINDKNVLNCPKPFDSFLSAVFSKVVVECSELKLALPHLLAAVLFFLSLASEGTLHNETLFLVLALVSVPLFATAEILLLTADAIVC